MAKKRFVDRFMDATGRLRAIFGPAQSSPLDHEMTAENKALLNQQEAAAQQWVTVKRPDGSSYLVPRDPEDQSRR